MKRASVTLSLDELGFLRNFKKSSKRSQREYDRANILLSLHKGKKDADIADFLEVERTIIWRTRLSSQLLDHQWTCEPVRQCAEHYRDW